MARISTHVLDIAQGAPARGVRLELYFEDHLIRSAETNSDGRTDAPLVSAETISIGTYQLVFHAGDYLRSSGCPEPLFYDEIAIRFLVSEAAGNYHVPLLLAPYSYSTYRGS
jgi:5-hydroxyisourate hydrolase